MNIDLDRRIISACISCRDHILYRASFIQGNSHYFRIIFSDKHMFDNVCDSTIINIETEYSDHGVTGELIVDGIKVEFCDDGNVYSFRRRNFIDGAYEVNLLNPGETRFFVDGLILSIYEINSRFNINLPLEYFRWTDEDITLMRMVCP